MFEVGWSEILVIAIVALIVFPTKDLPKLLRTVGQVVGKARRMAGDFQSQFNAALKEAEREIDLENTKEGLKSINPMTDLRKTLDPIRSLGDDIKKSVTAASTVTPAATASTVDGPMDLGKLVSEPAPAAATEPVAAPTVQPVAEPVAQPVAASVTETKEGGAA
ncbi:Sec-independent protein translocase protein TatB [Oryzibacter oryziterrae]|uniref:Sec-independent protein translocase protein TatB n=1 Tax=Oryzibacter oryziterrae TaxID=2766474 RepID=UPI001EFFF902|nr:Sec-independent protein translocase protein TatB [Oryzibacter oryziterrae]